MDAHQWEHVCELFEAAIELPPAARDAFVADLGEEPAIVRDELAALLAQHHDGTTALGLDVRPIAAELAMEAMSDTLPDAIGPYQIQRELGRGGMGVVYLARRADGQFEQEVALKLVKLGMDTPQAHNRFLLERQLLARLQHPNIARLLDGGLSADGRPYFAMEYINGVALMEYCTRQGLGVEARLALFVQVCEGVQYAHRNLVVHRDLKPSNILITQAGEPKLLDFGIAKLLDQPHDEQDAPLTQTAMALLTPEYGAPEQLRGEPVTTATDVYALGVILYELLSGQRPYDLGRRSSAEIHNAILSTTPQRPSVRVRASSKAAAQGAQTNNDEALASGAPAPSARLVRLLKGDLDIIVMHALNKQPERRYNSAAALASDLRRYLTHRPIQARADGLTYRVGKFVRRHAVASITSVVVAVTILSALATAAWQGRIATREAAKADAVSGFLLDMLGSVDPNLAQGREVTVREVLDQASAKLEDGSAAVAGEPAVEAAIRDTIGNTYRALGENDSAALQLQTALQLNRETLGDLHPQTLETMSALGAVYVELGRFDDAQPLYVEALRASTEVLGEDHEQTQRATARMAGLFWERGDFAAAEAQLRRNFEIRRRTLGPEHRSTLASRMNLAIAIVRQGRTAEATLLIEQTLAVQRRTLGDSHRHTLFSISNLASAYKELERFDEAVVLGQEVLALRRKIMGPEHPETIDAIGNLANAHLLAGQLNEAAALYDEALPLSYKVHGATHHQTLTTRSYYAGLLAQTGRQAEAEAELIEVIEGLRETLGDEHLSTREAVALLEELRQQSIP